MRLLSPCSDKAYWSVASSVRGFDLYTIRRDDGSGGVGCLICSGSRCRGGRKKS